MVMTASHLKASLAGRHQVEVSLRPAFSDPHAKNLCRTIREFLKLEIGGLKIIKVFTIYKQLSPKDVEAIAQGPLIDPVLEIASVGALPADGDWEIEVGFKPGVTDNAGKTAQTTLEDFLGRPFKKNESVHSSTKYILFGNLTRQEVEKIAAELLANPLIEDIAVRPLKEESAEIYNEPAHTKKSSPKVAAIPIDVDDRALMLISKERHLALNLQEMQAIRDYYADEAVRRERTTHGLSSSPTDVELEAFAQTWSEHCKHKIFNAIIHYDEDGKTETINSLFNTYIKKATEELAAHIDWLVSAFTDNAGIIRFNSSTFLAFKVETHNSPSALDPYGGALTGILGVNRDILGAGIGAQLIANTNVLCFAPPDFAGEIPERLMHPKRVLEGVCRGIEHGGNKSGIPTVNGSILFDERFLGKPLVYCGSIGILPEKIKGKFSHLKEILPNDLIVIAGGRTGKDGIHGATFSSEVLHDKSPASAVQIGDPFTQKRLGDFLLQARDKGLYRAITDNGAGGFSSSIGELAKLSGGCEIHLDQAPLKQHSMNPWEILLSESQERMTLAVPPENKEDLYALAEQHEVELSVLGSFTDSGRFHVMHRGKTVGLLSLDFLQDGLPKMSLEASWEPKSFIPLHIPSSKNYNEELLMLLARLNICSKESIVRQYDFEVQGLSVLKPLVGEKNDGPSDAAIIKADYGTAHEGMVIAHGICPRYSDFDTYIMAANAIDEAIRNCIAVGCDPSRIAILDNFCWPDPIYDPAGNPDGKQKLAQLVRANKALYEYAIAFKTPIISGKDSMKNDYKMGGLKISIPPTLLISAIGKIEDIEKAVSMDAKVPGDLIYVLGLTKNEVGGSEFAAMKKLKGGIPPRVHAKSSLKIYHLLYQAIQKGFIASCHDCSDGGLAVALAEVAFAGGLGIEASLKYVPQTGHLTDAELLFSESSGRFVATVQPKRQREFEALFKNCPIASIGKVSSSLTLSLGGLSGFPIIEIGVALLKEAWQRPLRTGKQP